MPVRAWDPTPYPDARKNRIPPLPESLGDVEPEIRAPRTFLWSLRLRGNVVNTRQFAASRRIVGPAIIKSISGVWFFATSASITLPIFGLYWNSAPYVSQSNQSAAAKPLGNSIWEFTRVATDVLAAPPSDGFTAGPGITINQRSTYPLDYVITDAEIYLAAFMEMRSNAGEDYADVVVQIFENCDRLDLVRLLG